MPQSVTQGAHESGGFAKLLKRNQKVLVRANLGFQGNQVNLLSPYPPVPSFHYKLSGVYGTISVDLGNSFTGLCPHLAELAAGSLLGMGVRCHGSWQSMVSLWRAEPGLKLLYYEKVSNNS